MLNQRYRRSTRTLAALGLLAALVVVLVGCEPPWDDDDDTPGSSTIQGNIASFEIDGVAILFDQACRPGVLAQITDLLTSSAYAAGNLGGITVYVRGLGLSGTTDDAVYSPPPSP